MGRVNIKLCTQSTAQATSATIIPSSRLKHPASRPHHHPGRTKQKNLLLWMLWHRTSGSHLTNWCWPVLTFVWHKWRNYTSYWLIILLSILSMHLYLSSKGSTKLVMLSERDTYPRQWETGGGVFNATWNLARWMYDVVCCLVVWNNLVLIQIDSPVHFPLERKLE